MKRNLIILMTVIVMLFASCEENIPNVYDIYFTGTEREMEQVPEGIPYTIPTDIPMKEGHDLIIFLDGTEVIPGQSIMLDSDIILECSYVRKNCTVSFTGIGRASVEVPINSEYTVPSDIPAKEGCHTVIKHGDTEVKAGDKILIEEDTSLDVTYKAMASKITFSTADETVYETTVAPGGSYTVPAFSEIGTKEGHILRIKHGENAVAPGYKIENITSDVTFSCVWDDSINITFSGIEGISSQRVKVGTEFTYPIINDYYISSYKVGEAEKEMGDPAGKASEDIEIVLKGEKGTSDLVITGGVVQKYTNRENTHIAIPNYVKNKPVTEICEDAFYPNVNQIETVLIPGTVKTIGASAFSGTGIKTLELNGDIEKIGVRAFYNCSNLVSVKISGNGSTVIEESAFSSTGITSLEISGVKSFGRDSFERAQMKTLTLNGPDLIDVNAFYNCPNLESVTITGNATNSTKVADYVFASCSNLSTFNVTGVESLGAKICDSAKIENLVFDEHLKTIGNQCFWGMTSIKTLSIAGTVNIGLEAFKGCTGLSSVSLTGADTVIGDNAFESCSGLLEFVSSEVKSVGNSAFLFCSGLEKVSLSGKIKKIDRDAFRELSYLSDVSISGTDVVIEGSSFSSNDRLDKLSLTGTGIKVGSYAFYRCDLSRTVDLSGVTEIGEQSFSYTSIKNLDLDGVVSIGNYAFNACGSLAGVKINGIGTTDIGEDVFRGCTKLKTLTATGVRSIGARAFQDTVLESLSLDEHIRTIGMFSFGYMTSLKTVSIKGSVAIANKAFYKCTQLNSISLTGAGTSIGEEAFLGCDLTSNFDISGVKSIGNFAFTNSNVVEVLIPASVESITGKPFSSCLKLEKLNVSTDAQLGWDWGTGAPVVLVP